MSNLSPELMAIIKQCGYKFTSWWDKSSRNDMNHALDAQNEFAKILQPIVKSESLKEFVYYSDDLLSLFPHIIHQEIFSVSIQLDHLLEGRLDIVEEMITELIEQIKNNLKDEDVLGYSDFIMVPSKTAFFRNEMEILAHILLVQNA